MYGDDGLAAIEVKRSRTVTSRDLSGLRTFMEDYPATQAVMLYGGDKHLHIDGIRVMPILHALTHLHELL